MKECEATNVKIDLQEIEQIVEKLESGEEVGPLFIWSSGFCFYNHSLHFLCSFVLCPLILTFVPIVIEWQFDFHRWVSQVTGK